MPLRRSPPRFILLAAQLLALCLTALSSLQAQERLFEQEPFDRILLKDKSEISVVPLELPGRQLPERPRPNDMLPVRLLDDMAQPYEIAWRDIAEIKLFEQMVLDEAQALAEKKQFDEAYDYFLFLETNHPDWPGLGAAVEQYLYDDAANWQRRGEYDYALSLLREIYRRNPERQDLDKAIGAATGKLAEQKIAAEDFLSARRLLANLDRLYSEHPVAVKWQNQLSDRAQQLATQAAADLEAGRMREVYQTAGAALAIWPKHEASRELLIEAQRRYPRVLVGVSLAAGPNPTTQMHDWAGRRASRLVHRTLLEFVGYGSQGAEYACPVGQLEKQELDTRLVFKIDPAAGNAANPLSGHDIARSLLAATDPGQPTYRPSWANLAPAVSVRDVFEVNVKMNRPHVQPDSLLRLPLVSWTAVSESSSSAAGLGGYSLEPLSDTESAFVAHRANESSPTQPTEIVERRYDRSRDAVAALLEGKIDILDRIAPWDIPRIQTEKKIALERYAAPTVYCLLLNADNPFLANRSFRRALVYGINREVILREQLLRDAPPEAGVVISGPFPKGKNSSDSSGYAYDDRIRPRPYDPRLAITLTSVALAEDSAARKSREEEPLSSIPPLTLAHAPHDPARVACRAIQKQLSLLGLTVTLEELSPGGEAALSAKADLTYAELAVCEPITDARTLLGPGGLSGRSTPYMDLALRQLEQAKNWKQARNKLLEIHRIASDDAAVVPLWQIDEYFAYHANVSGIGKAPASLYQRIESWSVAARIPEDAP